MRGHQVDFASTSCEKERQFQETYISALRAATVLDALKVSVSD